MQLYHDTWSHDLWWYVLHRTWCCRSRYSSMNMLYTLDICIYTHIYILWYGMFIWNLICETKKYVILPKQRFTNRGTSIPDLLVFLYSDINSRSWKWKRRSSRTAPFSVLLHVQMGTSGLITQLDTGQFFAHRLQQGDHVKRVDLQGCTRAFGGC